uniref:Tick transposon n=1 Tax=Rhipicephalus appendiculatus TaxID=34631 RepID=A0A131YIH1_RHIAP
MTAAVPPAAIVMQPPREPPTFHGSPSEDFETWLETFERVSTFNNWDADDKLRHVYFYLDDASRTWFENRESTLRTWDIFRSTFLATFTSVVRKERSATLLETRVQLMKTKTEETTRLFRHADPAISEERTFAS